jgi:8-amino-7-oxononanoate synthase
MRRRPELLRTALADIDNAAQRRVRSVVQAYAEGGAETGGERVIVDGQSLVNFCSNDYLGLARHPALASAMCQASIEFGSGSGAAHLVCGHSQHHHALEEELASFLNRDRALLFSTGYMANIGVISSFSERNEVMLADRLNHASLLDGARLSKARLLRYPHNDHLAAARMLDSHAPTSLLCTDGVFSMDGDVAPLSELATLCRAHQAWLVVDDAHGIGVLGATGGGSVQQAGLDTAAVPLLVGTLGKALGSFGAFVAGDSDVIEFLMHKARSYVYTTALPPAVAAATRVALRLCQNESWRRERLHALIARFRRGAAQLNLRLADSATAIQPLLIGDSQHALALSAALRKAGFWVSAIRPPTVPKGGERLRITLSAAHHERDIDALLDALSANIPVATVQAT